MPLTFKASGGSGDFTPCPAGNHIAVCDLIADLGVQNGSGKFPSPKHQVLFRFEIPAERVEYKDKDGKPINSPAIIYQTFTASMHEKANLRKQLESWRGRKFTDEEAEQFDVAATLGKPCMLNVIHTPKGDKVYANISSISPLVKGMTPPKPENDLLCYMEGDSITLKKLPEWIQKKVSEQVNLAKENRDRDINEDLGITDRDIPEEFFQDDEERVPF